MRTALAGQVLNAYLVGVKKRKMLEAEQKAGEMTETGGEVAAFSSRKSIYVRVNIPP